jgi:hypothetical protein
MAIFLVILTAIGQGAEESPPEIVISEEKLNAFIEDTFGWSTRDYQIKILQHEFLLDDYESRILDLNTTVDTLNLAVKKAEDINKLTKSMYRMKMVRAGLIGAGVGVVGTTVAIILVRLAVAGKI